ncbi:uncharacterized protein LOC122542689 [Chiloscyllium plagiosum]|uniref:uncharacterized protein LOC122542689 n=1 Tax=Chiloscyllium plagiosum TaxID=36176 RepID=UPI001CB8665F|nr:uncharacterized protein LOC122542689 [Chiloscyllium plagiosum]
MALTGSGIKWTAPPNQTTTAKEAAIWSIMFMPAPSSLATLSPAAEFFKEGEEKVLIEKIYSESPQPLARALCLRLATTGAWTGSQLGDGREPSTNWKEGGGLSNPRTADNNYLHCHSLGSKLCFSEVQAHMENLIQWTPFTNKKTDRLVPVGLAHATTVLFYHNPHASDCHLKYPRKGKIRDWNSDQNFAKTRRSGQFLSETSRKSPGPIFSNSSPSVRNKSHPRTASSFWHPQFKKTFFFKRPTPV